MTIWQRWIGLACALVFVAGCSTVDAVLWPSLVGEDPSTHTQVTVVEVEDSEDEVAVLYDGDTIDVEPDVDEGGSPEVVIEQSSFGETALATRDPLVVIRFVTDDVAYQDELRQSVNAALERKPDVLFDVVAVASSAGSAEDAAFNRNAATRNAEDVLRSLSDMGLPAERLTQSTITGVDTYINEVRIYVR